VIRSKEPLLSAAIPVTTRKTRNKDD